ncbi:MAG: hypothetical protein R2875_01820 [Desulfobacterales bacterium]
MSPSAVKSPKKHDAGESAGGLSVKDIFDKMPDAFQPDAQKVWMRYSITFPENPRRMTVTVKDGTCAIDTGKTDKPTCTLNITIRIL